VDATVVTAGGTSAANANDQFTFTGGTPPSSSATYRGDLGRSGYYPAETGLTTANAASLKVHWTAGGGVDSFAQPIVANNMLFWSDWSGSEHGANLNGQDLWKTNIGTTTPPASDNCSPTSAGPTSTPTLGTVGGVSALFVGGGNGVMYALNAQTGAILWQTRLGTSPDNFLWDSPALYNGTIYMGVASYGDCPLVQGQLVALNAATGAITGTADMVPNGCIGGGIWSSPTVDTVAGTIWVTTGTPHACSNGTAFAPALVELRASDLSVLGFWNVPVSSQSAGDPDFGSTPTLFTATINGQVRSLVGAVNKDAIFYAWDRTNPAAGPVWQSTIATASGDPAVGSIVSASWDGTNLYVGGGNTTINGTSCAGSLDALNPSTGAFVWRSCQAGEMYGGITEVPGVIIEGTLAGAVLFLNAATGATLLNYNSGVSEIQGECAVSNGIVYIPLDDGALVALGQ
jgi:polyvinyl alcohol dehydrogenase (cytochrome)